jgi:DNA topoisomerase-1
MEQDELRPPTEKSAREAGLRYVNGDTPGITRKRWGRGFTYLDPRGNHITDETDRQHLNELAIPPAWTEVWICPDDNCHILATGRDDRGRKQYIYHPKWREVRDESKFYRMIAFGEALPGLRARVEQDLALPDLPREKVLAAVIKLLDTTLIRVGNREYASRNDHYGLTTLRDRHVEISGTKIRFDFMGKSGKEIVVEIADKRLARIVKACRDVPGQHLFQYLDEEENRHAIDSGDANDYLREITGADFTAKDFRTWGGTVFAIATLREFEPFEEDAVARKNVIEAVDAVAEQLGNTRAVCREYYIHPGVLECYENGTMIEYLEEDVEEVEGLHPEECEMLALLRTLDVGK